jgi:diguanylate cyclase (GGDEF)-like protein
MPASPVHPPASQPLDLLERRAKRTLALARAFAAFATVALIAWPFIEERLAERTQIMLDLIIVSALVVGALTMSRALSKAYVRVERAKREAAQLNARRDELSGLFNVGYLRESTSSLIAESARDGSSFALVVLDLDNFKEINDRFGHAAGDGFISAIGRAMSEQIEGRGIAARPAGDMFSILLPGADRTTADVVASDILVAIAAASVDGLPRNAHIQISASYGIAVYPRDGADSETLTSCAERELHRRKVEAMGDHLRTSERNSQDVFFAIGEAIGVSLDPDEMLTNFCSAVSSSIGFDSGIWLIDEHDEIRIRTAHSRGGRWQEQLDELQKLAPITRSEAEQSGMLRAQPVYIDDVRQSAIVPERFRRFVPPETWMICAPVPATRGIIVLSSPHTRAAPPDTGLVLAIARHAASALTNAAAFQRARGRGEQLASLAGLGGLLIGEGDFEERLGGVARHIVDVTGFSSLSIDTADPTGERPFVRQFYGRKPDGAEFTPDETRVWLTLRPALTEPAIVDFLREADRPIIMTDPIRQVPEIYRHVIRDSGIKMVVVMPIIWQDDVKGLMYFSHYEENGFDDQDVALMRTIAAQLAPAIQVASLHVELAHSYAELKDAHLHALLRLAYAAEARDPYTECHLQRIRGIAQAIGLRLGIEGDALEALGYGAVVHDLGKLRIPDSILMNPGSLSDDEWAQMKKHPEWGAEIIGSNAFYDVARQVAANHHERWDGSGYPGGLAGDDIPLVARIVSVADVYDALTSARPYKAAWASERALVELMRMRGNTLCPTCVDTFMELWREGEVQRIDAETAEDTMEFDFRTLYAA